MKTSEHRSQYVHVCKPETLREAYRIAKTNDGAPGVDGETFEAIEAKGLDVFLDQVREELLERTYRPERLRKVETPRRAAKCANCRFHRSETGLWSAKMKRRGSDRHVSHAAISSSAYS